MRHPRNANNNKPRSLEDLSIIRPWRLYMNVLQFFHRFSVAPRLSAQILTVGGAALLLGACAGSGSIKKARPGYSPKVVNYGQTVPKGGGHYKIGRPYQVANKWYRPRKNTKYDRVGVASWYGDLFHGRKTANGEVFDMDALTAAHPTLPLPVLVRVTNLENNRSLVVRVNDRGPYRHNRIIDLSRKTAQLLGFKKKGTAKVRVKYLRRAPMNGDASYERQVAASKAWGNPNARSTRLAQRGGKRHGQYSVGRYQPTGGASRKRNGYDAMNAKYMLGR